MSVCVCLTPVCFTCLPLPPSLQNPKDVAYVFSGYAPLSVRLVEILERPNGFAAFEEVTTEQRSPFIYNE